MDDDDVTHAPAGAWKLELFKLLATALAALGALYLLIAQSTLPVVVFCKFRKLKWHVAANELVGHMSRETMLALQRAL